MPKSEVPELERILRLLEPGLAHREDNCVLCLCRRLLLAQNRKIIALERALTEEKL